MKYIIKGIAAGILATLLGLDPHETVIAIMLLCVIGL
jgi:hypothetical protein